MSNNQNLVQKFLKSEAKLDYRGNVEGINRELAYEIVTFMGGVDRFIEAQPVVKSFGVEAVLDNYSDEDLLGFFYCHTDKIVQEIALIGQSLGTGNESASDYILNNTDCEYSESEIKQALADGEQGEAEGNNTSTEICKWVVFQVTSELCGNYREFIEKNTLENNTIA